MPEWHQLDSSCTMSEQQELDRKTEQLELQKEKLNSFNPKKSGSDKKEVKDPGGVVVHMKPGEVVEQKPVPGVGAGVDGRVKYDIQSWSGSYAMIFEILNFYAMFTPVLEWELRHGGGGGGQGGPSKHGRN